MPGIPRTIVHLDLDAFFASVEILERPELTGKPVLVGGRPEERGVVATASYPARAFGVHSAMPMAQALRLCPHAVVVAPRHDLYHGYSRRVMAILREITPLMEQVSVDEAYLDLTPQVDEWEQGADVARRLQERVRHEVGLSASLGVAPNKMLAKIASDYHKPGGLTVVRPGEEIAFLAPLPVRVLPGVGPVTAAKLAGLGITSVGELACMENAELRARFGRHGLEMAQQALGVDLRPLVTEPVLKSLSQETTFARDLADPRALQRELGSLCRGLGERLRAEGRTARTVVLKLRYADFTTLTRQMSLAVATAEDGLLYQAARVLLERAWQPGRPVRLLGVAGRQLSEPGGQLPLL